MGYNTVAFLLNDLMHETARSPKALTWALTHPPNGPSTLERNSWRQQVSLVADEAGEPRLHPQALEVLPTFHADWTQFFVAGGNLIEALETVRYGKTKDGRPTVTLVLPKWWRK